MELTKRSRVLVAFLTAFVDQLMAAHTEAQIDFVHDLRVIDKYRNSSWRTTGSDGVSLADSLVHLWLPFPFISIFNGHPWRMHV